MGGVQPELSLITSRTVTYSTLNNFIRLLNNPCVTTLMGSFKADVKVQSFSRPQPFKADVKVQSVAGDPKFVGQRVVIYGDKTRPLLDGLRGRVVSVARVYSAETRLYTVRLDTPLVLLETDSPRWRRRRAGCSRSKSTSSCRSWSGRAPMSKAHDGKGFGRLAP